MTQKMTTLCMIDWLLCGVTRQKSVVSFLEHNNETQHNTNYHQYDEPSQHPIWSKSHNFPMMFVHYNKTI